ncbi:hypothetical protein CYY_000681 [Polysphondylium violaceum]|uniref:Uncharacterized protein n=1 Tax=Polysphondylium violaceum TaxID=133409 RepID=A0A8J4V5D1_9MYCE|nr:hypothetical protein CYY_000681 [Polysphondylium violaceum]
MEKVKKLFFQAVEDGDKNQFIELSVKNQYVQGKNQDITKFSVEEYLQFLQVREYEPFFQQIKDNLLVPLIEQDCLTPSDPANDGDIHDKESEKNQEKVILQGLKTMSGIVSLSTHFLNAIDKKQSVAPTSLFDIIYICYDLILQMKNYSERIVQEKLVSTALAKQLETIYAKLANDISLCCETWYKQKRDNAILLVPITVSYLVQKASESDKDASIKRLYQMRYGIPEFDFREKDTEPIRDLLVRSFIEPHFLKTIEGRKFLVFLLTIHPLVNHIHLAVKSQLHLCKKSICQSYAEIYFKAWCQASGPVIGSIEAIIHDLVNGAIFSSNDKLHKSLCTFMNYLHLQKPHKGVDSMLLNAYGPNLFRSLKFANPLIRANAARLFISAFPLIDSESSIQEIEEYHQTQFNLLQDILFDPYIPVRATAVQGAFEILSKYWEVIPLGTSRSLLMKLLTSQAHDKASSLVRETVFLGIKFMLNECHLSHSILAIMLPGLRDLIHDSSERVRGAFLDVLLYIKTISTIHYLDVVPVDHLLERLVLDNKNANLSKKLTELLVEPYFPDVKKNAILLNRCIGFIQTKKQAAFTFYSNIVNFVQIKSGAKLAASLMRFLSTFVKKHPDINQVIEKHTIESSSKKKSNKKSSKKDKQDKEEQEEQEEQQEKEVKDISLEDFDSILEIIYLVLSSVKKRLEKDTDDKTTWDNLLNYYSDDDICGLYIWAFSATIPRVNSMAWLIKIASLFSFSNFPSFSEMLLRNFEEVDHTTPDILKENLLKCLFAWNKADLVMNIIIESLVAPIQCITEILNQKEQQEQESLLAKRKKKNQYQEDQDDESKLTGLCDRALVSITFLDMLLKSEDSRAITINLKEEMVELIASLSMYLQFTHRRICCESGISDKIICSQELSLSRTLLTSGYLLYFKVLIHVEGDTGAIDKVSNMLTTPITWWVEQIFPCLESFLARNNLKKRSRSEQDNDDDEGDTTQDYIQDANEKPFIVDICLILMTFLSEGVTFGFYPALDMYEHVLNTIKLCKGVPIFSSLVPIYAKFAFQLYFTCPRDVENLEGSKKVLLAILDTIDANKSLESTDTPYSFFKLNDFILLYHQKGTLGELIKPIVDIVFKEFTKILLPKLINTSSKKKSDIPLKVLSKLEQVSPISNFIISSLSKSSLGVSQLSEHLSTYVASNSMNQKSIYFTLNLISIIILTQSKSSTDYSSIQNLLITFISKLPHLANSDDYSDEEDENDGPDESTLLNKNRIGVSYAQLLRSANNLLNHTMKENEQPAPTTSSVASKKKKNEKVSKNKK